MVGSMRTLSDGQTDWRCWLHKDSRRVLITLSISISEFWPSPYTNLYALRVDETFGAEWGFSNLQRVIQGVWVISIEHVPDHGLNLCNIWQVCVIDPVSGRKETQGCHYPTEKNPAKIEEFRDGFPAIFPLFNLVMFSSHRGNPETYYTFFG